MSDGGSPDPVRLALGAAAAGAAFGGAATTAGVALFRLVQSETRTLSDDQGFWMVTGSLLAGIGCAFATAWILAKGIPELWRRVALACTATFGALLLSGAAAPADALGGSRGLTIYLVLLLAAGIWSSARARRWAHNR